MRIIATLKHVPLSLLSGTKGLRRRGTILEVQKSVKRSFIQLQEITLFTYLRFLERHSNVIHVSFITLLLVILLGELFDAVVSDLFRRTLYPGPPHVWAGLNMSARSAARSAYYQLKFHAFTADNLASTRLVYHTPLDNIKRYFCYFLASVLGKITSSVTLFSTKNVSCNPSGRHF